ncbi:FtsX-like permease family protein [Agrococcus sp. DT81.2]|uniref:ABC transporter permease n=1 Tax=Agrococcus sp. DT81.2 TaxID=3393414 RepID=UPI003CE57256
MTAATTVAVAPVAPARRLDASSRTGASLAFGVAALAAAFGTALSTLMEHAALALYGERMVAESETARLLLAIAGTLLIGVSVVVAAIVVRQALTGAVDDLRGEIALRRLLGATAGSERRRMLTRFVGVGVGGAAIGWVAGVLVALPVEALLSQLPGGFELTGMPPLMPAALIPAGAVAVAAAAAAWLATREVLAVTPLEALRGSGIDVETVRRPRRRAAIVGLGIGALLLAAAVALGTLTPLAVLVGFAGGVVLVVGIVGIAPAVAPPLVALAGRAMGRSVPARVAAGTLATHPGRTASLVLALFVGAAIVTMMVTAGASLTTSVLTIERDPVFRAELEALLTGVTAVVTAIVGFSAVLGVLGFVAAMLLSVRRRTREIGLLRMLGLRRAHTMRMLLAEAGAITIVAVTTGFGVGLLLGWIGVQSMVGSVPGVVSTAPTIPWQLPLSLVVAGLAIATAASLPAGRRASRIAPLAAVAAD